MCCTAGWLVQAGLKTSASRAGNGRLVKSRVTESKGANKGCLLWSCCEISEERGNFWLWHVW